MSFSSYEQVFVINNQLVSGVMSVDAGYSTQTEPLYIAGMGYVDNYISGPTEGQFNVSRYMLGSDFVKEIGDDAHVSGGVILNNGQGVGFTRGRLLNYTVSCNVGSVPEISNTFKAYGNLGGGISPIARWVKSIQYEVGSLVSLSKTGLDEAGSIKGIAEDEVYECKKKLDDNGWVYEKKTDPNIKISKTAWSALDPPSDQALYTDAGYIKPNFSGGSLNAADYWTKINHLNAKQSLEAKFSMEKREYTIPTQGSITVGFAGSEDNAVLGFNYTRGLDLESLYALREERFKGTPLTDYEALDIQVIYPIKTQLDFTVSFDNYKLSDMRAFLDYANWGNSRIEQDIFVKVYDPQDMQVIGQGELLVEKEYEIVVVGNYDFVLQHGAQENQIGKTFTAANTGGTNNPNWRVRAAPIMKYQINKAKLLSEHITAQTADDTTLKISFEGYETDLNTPDPHDRTTRTSAAAEDHSAEFPIADSVNLENKISQVKT